METQQGTRRLCSEIQLFDLCDLDYCTNKEGRFCTNPAVLARFEAIKEEDERSPQQYLSEEFDEDEEGEGEGEGEGEAEGDDEGFGSDDEFDDEEDY
jgi:hypothetical protein